MNEGSKRGLERGVWSQNGEFYPEKGAVAWSLTSKEGFRLMPGGLLVTDELIWIAMWTPTDNDTDTLAPKR